MKFDASGRPDLRAAGSSVPAKVARRRALMLGRILAVISLLTGGAMFWLLATAEGLEMLGVLALAPFVAIPGVGALMFLGLAESAKSTDSPPVSLEAVLRTSNGTEDGADH